MPWVSQRRYRDEGENRDAPAEKCVEGVIRDEAAVEELDDPEEHEDDLERVDELDLLGR